MLLFGRNKLCFWGKGLKYRYDQFIGDSITNLKRGSNSLWVIWLALKRTVFFFFLPQLNKDIAALCRPATPLVDSGVLCDATATQIRGGMCRTVDATCVLRASTDSPRFGCISQGVVDRRSSPVLMYNYVVEIHIPVQLREVVIRSTTKSILLVMSSLTSSNFYTYVLITCS